MRWTLTYWGNHFQHIHISNHYIVHLKIIQYYINHIFYIFLKNINNLCKNDAKSNCPSFSCDNQKCLTTSSDIVDCGGGITPWLKTSDHRANKVLKKHSNIDFNTISICTLSLVFQII